MTQTVTAAYDDIEKAINAYDELVSKGFPREKLLLDRETNQIKVIIPDTARPEAEEILKRHEPNDTWSQPYDE